MFYDVLILGGGASGLMSAYLLAQKSLSVGIIDSQPFLGKKLLVTGNGKCNLTNNNMGSRFYNQNIDGYLEKFNANDTIMFFKKLGLVTYADDSGRVYPYSNTAKSVVDIFNYHLKISKLIQFLNAQVNGLELCDDGNYKIVTNEQIFYAKNVIYSMGNNLSPIKKLNLEINMPTLSLVALKTIESTKTLEGLRLSDVKVSVNVNGKVCSEMGEVLFKDHGLSGIVIFNLSSQFARQKENSGKVCIDLMYNLHRSKEEIKQMLLARCQQFKTASDIFLGLLNEKIGNYILGKLDIKKDLSCKNLTAKQVNDILNSITNLEFNVCGFYDNNQVVSGGVDLRELNENLQSNKYRHLYICGEAVDVDGVCGGYNLQWAWTSGFIVSNKILSDMNYEFMCKK